MTDQVKQEVKQVFYILVGLALVVLVYSKLFASNSAFVRGIGWTTFVGGLFIAACLFTGLYGFIRSLFVKPQVETTKPVVPLEPDTTVPTTVEDVKLGSTQPSDPTTTITASGVDKVPSEGLIVYPTDLQDTPHTLTSGVLHSSDHADVAQVPDQPTGGSVNSDPQDESLNSGQHAV